MNVVELYNKDLRHKRLPFYATVKGDYLDCYNWKHGDRLKVIDLDQELDAEHNEYLWIVMNLDRNHSRGGVATYQIEIEE